MPLDVLVTPSTPFQARRHALEAHNVPEVTLRAGWLPVTFNWASITSPDPIVQKCAMCLTTDAERELIETWYPAHSGWLVRFVDGEDAHIADYPETGEGYDCHATAPADPSGDVFDQIVAELRVSDPERSARLSEKITLSLSAELLTRLDTARMQLRADYDLNASRGQIIRDGIRAHLNEFGLLGENSALIEWLDADMVVDLPDTFAA